MPVDAIAGTSMGAVVGGLYASGLSAADIERVMTSVDWQDAFRDRPPRSRPQFPPQARRSELPGEVSARPEGRQVPPAARPGPGTEAHADPARPHAAGGADPELRRSRHPVPRRRHRHRHRRARRHRSRRPNYGDAREPVRARCVLAGGIRRTHAGRRRPVVEPADRRGARDGRRRPHRGRLRFSAARARQARFGGDRVQPDARHPDPAQHRRAAQDAEGPRRRHRSGARGLSRRSTSASTRRRCASARRPRAAQSERLAGVVGSRGGIPAHRRRACRACAVAAARSNSCASSRAPSATPAPSRRCSATRSASRSTCQALEKRVERAVRPGQSGNLRLSPGAERARSRAKQPGYGLALNTRRNSWGPNYLRFGLQLQNDFEGNSSFNAAARARWPRSPGTAASGCWDLQVGETPRVATEVYLPVGYRSRWFVMPHAEFQIRTLPLDRRQRAHPGRVPRAHHRLWPGPGPRARQLRRDSRGRRAAAIGAARVRVGDPLLPPIGFRLRTMSSANSATTPSTT